MTRQMLSTVSSGRMPRWRCDQAAHHVGLARRAERGADFLGLLHRDQAVDDVAALHQQAVHLLVDAVDLVAQILQRGRRRRSLVMAADVGRPACIGLDSAALAAALIGKTALKAKKTLTSRRGRPQCRSTVACLDEKPHAGLAFGYSVVI